MLTNCKFFFWFKSIIFFFNFLLKKKDLGVFFELTIYSNKWQLLSTKKNPKKPLLFFVKNATLLRLIKRTIIYTFRHKSILSTTVGFLSTRKNPKKPLMIVRVIVERFIKINQDYGDIRKNVLFI